jgi:hypothetical protein
MFTDHRVPPKPCVLRATTAATTNTCNKDTMRLEVAGKRNDPNDRNLNPKNHPKFGDYVLSYQVLIGA